MELLMKNHSTSKEQPGCHQVGFSAQLQAPLGALASHSLGQGDSRPAWLSHWAMPITRRKPWTAKSESGGAGGEQRSDALQVQKVLTLSGIIFWN